MSSFGLHLIRRQQRTVATWVLALFCLVWVQAALLPCAMAYGGSSDVPEEHCSYCPPAEPACGHAGEGVAAACAYPDQAQADSRAGVGHLPVLELPVVAWRPLPGTADAAPWPDGPGLSEPAGPRLSISYCRFLE